MEKIIEWNQGAKRDDTKYDKKICQSLLLSLVDKEKIFKSEIDDEVLQFIKGKLLKWNICFYLY